MAPRTKTTVVDGQGYVLHGLVFLLMSTHSHSILEDDDNTDLTL
ncbi:hypothetical protein THAOC_24176, partial [Thalassiosira oceanica]